MYLGEGRYPGEQEEIGVYYLPVDGIPGLYHAVIYLKHFPNGKQEILTLQALPTIRDPSLIDKMFEVVGGGQLGPSPFGRIFGVDQRYENIPSGALKVTPLSFGPRTYDQWRAIKQVFDGLKSEDYEYRPLHNNSNTFVATALANAGIDWQQTIPFDPRKHFNYKFDWNDPNPWRIPDPDPPRVPGKDYQLKPEPPPARSFPGIDIGHSDYGSQPTNIGWPPIGDDRDRNWWDNTQSLTHGLGPNFDHTPPGRIGDGNGVGNWWQTAPATNSPSPPQAPATPGYLDNAPELNDRGAPQPLNKIGDGNGITNWWEDPALLDPVTGRLPSPNTREGLLRYRQFAFAARNNGDPSNPQSKEQPSNDASPLGEWSANTQALTYGTGLQESQPPGAIGDGNGIGVRFENGWPVDPVTGRLPSPNTREGLLWYWRNSIGAGRAPDSPWPTDQAGNNTNDTWPLAASTGASHAPVFAPEAAPDQTGAQPSYWDQIFLPRTQPAETLPSSNDLMSILKLRDALGPDPGPLFPLPSWWPAR